MKSRHSRERAEFRALLSAAADTRLPDKQLERERLHLFRMFFRPSLTKRKGFKVRTKRDEDRRQKARKAALNDGFPEHMNRAMKRALGTRGHGYGFGRMDVNSSRERGRGDSGL